MPYFVYILECADTTYYCGYTTNLTSRIKAHNTLNSGAKYTRSRRPVKLVFFEGFKLKSVALKREAEIKKLSRDEKRLLFLKR